MKSILIAINIILVGACGYLVYKLYHVDTEVFFYSQLRSAGEVVVASTEQPLILSGEKGKLDKSKVEIKWKETWRYYIDLANDDWNFKITGSKFVFNAPEIKAYLPGTIDTNFLETKILNWSLIKGDYKHINELIKGISKESSSKVKSSLLADSEQRALIEQQAKDSIKNLVKSIAEKADVKFEDISVIFE